MPHASLLHANNNHNISIVFCYNCKGLNILSFTAIFYEKFARRCNNTINVLPKVDIALS